VRCEASRHFRNKKWKYVKDKINEPATNGKNKNTRDLYRGINESKRDYQPRSFFVKDENGALLADPTTNNGSTTSLRYCMYKMSPMLCI
jgi:hypothetical protein